ncbi:unnamed protein product [Orchesella dallaii]|uniref:Uncharacterized protein n=1 Tax=Orchesella dallaii TaxID=48710 RepID=A0ABP1R853_9HEXA
MTLQTYSKLAQGLGIFNALGLNTVECHKEACPTPLSTSRRDGLHICSYILWHSTLGKRISWPANREPYHATSHFYEHGVFRNSEERPQFIYERGSVRPEKIDVTDGGDGPRTMVAHFDYDVNAYYDQLAKQYSNLCAAFDTPECLFGGIFNEVDGGLEKAFSREEERYFGKYLDFIMESTCSSRDAVLIGRLLDNDNKLPWMRTEPWRLTDHEIRQKIYCCLPAEYYRLSESPNYAAAFIIWKVHMDYAEESFQRCYSFGEFGFPIEYGPSARYPRGVTAEDCSKNKCQYDPKKVVGADYCNRQFDPSESSIIVPECTMNYLNYD